jgi:hypothetical protein
MGNIATVTNQNLQVRLSTSSDIFIIHEGLEICPAHVNLAIMRVGVIVHPSGISTQI